jgi:YD repeat-containing protein
LDLDIDRDMIQIESDGFLMTAGPTLPFGVVCILFWIIAFPNPAVSCGSGCSHNSEDPLAFIHFWYKDASYLDGSYYKYGSYQFNCDGTQISFCPLSSGINPTQTPQDTAPKDLSYHCDCGVGTNPDGDKEWGGTLPPGIGPPPGPPPPGGNPCCPSLDRVGKPINLMTGNMYHEQVDLRLPSSIPGDGFAFVRTYNSQAAMLGKTGVLGYGWTYTYDIGLEAINQDSTGKFYRMRIHLADGRGVYFLAMPDESYKGMYGERATLVKNPDTSFTYTFQNGTKYFFSPLSGTVGRIARIEDVFGNATVFGYNGSGQVIDVADPIGRHLTLTYTSDGKIETLANPVGGVHRYSYDASGNLALLTAPDGSTTTYQYQSSVNVHLLTAIRNTENQLVAKWDYDAQGRAIESSVDGINEKISLSYGPYSLSGTQTVLTNSRGSQTTYTYGQIEGMHQVRAISGPGCVSCRGTDIASFIYDGRGFGPIKTVDLKGTITTYGFDASRRLMTSRTDPVGTTTYTYHPNFDFILTETVKSVLNPSQNYQITYDYDNDGNTTSNENPGLLVRRQVMNGLTRNSSGIIVPFQQVSSFTYDSMGRLTQVDGPRSDVTDTTARTYYPIVSGDAKSGMLQSVTRANGSTPLTTTYNSYDKNGNVTQITDPNGQVTTYTYDPLNRVWTITHLSDNGTTTYTYDANGNVDFVTLPEGNTIDYTFDAANRLTKITDALGHSIGYTYDTEGNRRREERKDPSGVIKAYLDMTYDEANRLKRITNPDATFTEYGYDSMGNRTSLSDPNGNTTLYDYDALNRLTTTTQPGPIITISAYDSQDHLTGVTDANGHANTYEYDDLGHLVTQVSPDTGTTRNAYDEAGNLISKTDANNILTMYDYDALNRLTHVHFPDSTQDIIYNYDGSNANGLGRLTSMTDPSGTTTYSYTGKGEIYQESKIFAGLSNMTYTMTYGYDKNGNLTGITYPSGQRVGYGMDGADRVASVTGTNSGVTRTYVTVQNYLPFGPYQTVGMFNGVTTTFTYDNQYRLREQQIGKVNQTPLMHHAYNPLSKWKPAYHRGPSESGEESDI